MAGWDSCLMEQLFLLLIAQLLPLCLLTCSFSFPGEFLSLGESPHLCWIFQKFCISLESLNWDPSMKIAWENYMDVKKWRDATAFSTSILPSCFCPSCYFWSSVTYFAYKNGNSQIGVWGPLNTWFSYQNIWVLPWWVMLKPDVQPYHVLQSL